jgi:hypothetical protein
MSCRCEIKPRSKGRSDFISEQWSTSKRFLDEMGNYTEEFYDRMAEGKV